VLSRVRLVLADIVAVCVAEYDRLPLVCSALLLADTDDVRVRLASSLLLAVSVTSQSFPP
jgi:hypothetical protein